MHQHNDDDQLVELLFRNGTITVIGIVLSFSLSFVTQWANNPVPWELDDLPALACLFLGIAAQLRSLLVMLGHDSLKRRVFDRASRTFMIGVLLIAAGVLAAIIADLVALLK
ncbi:MULTISPECIES: hypothetical protein [unclassified Aminobacter]|uniref:hypothetical protein n=1 Tax=unclassified Aminobacter TaxID=2644704 RepID=UPI0004648EBB|nr:MULTISPECIES: hypothetical protein [unclassified Aminobacter]TWG50032.1 hypothetical protein L610_000600000360 [Aminobacter sp. J44]TWH35440.1 hypothetical protein L611_001300000690 [Aminobacter sp. J15]